MRMLMLSSIIACMLLSAALGATITVGPEGQDYTTIGAAIAAAISGDIIVVYPNGYGLPYDPYYENLVITGKSITLKSPYEGPGDEHYAYETVIDGSDNGSCLILTNSSSQIIGLTFQNGRNGDGGGIHIDNSSGETVSIENCVIKQNTADGSIGDHGFGGGVYCDGGNHNVTILSCIIADNDALGTTGFNGYGGGIHVGGPGVSTSIGGNTIAGNQAAYGGGIAIDESAADISNNMIVSNTARRAGGIDGLCDASPPYDDSIIVRSNSMSGNSATNGNGGSVNIDGRVYRVSDNLVSHSTTTGQGGGLCMTQTGAPLEGNVIFNNEATSPGGGCYMGVTAGQVPIVRDNTFFGNSSLSAAGGLRVHGSGATVNVQNCIFWENSAPSYPQLLFSGGVASSVTFCDVQGGYTGVGNINDNPLFCGAESGDFTLNEESPCVGAGTGDPDIGALGIGCGLVIESTQPATYQVDIAPSTSIQVTFSELMNASTFDCNSSFIVKGSISGFHDGGFSFNNRTVTYSPTSGFVTNERVTTTLTTDLAAQSGPLLYSPHVWEFTISSGTAPGTFGAGDSYLSAERPSRNMCGGDFNLDGTIDLATVHSSLKKISIVTNDGSGAFSHWLDLSTSSSPYSIAVADLDNDGDVDIAAAGGTTDKVTVFRNQDGTGFSSFTTQTVGDWPYSIVAGDFDGDGYDDLAVACITDNSIAVLMNNGSGVFLTPFSSYDAGLTPSRARPVDIDSDGDLDIVTTGWYAFSIMRNNGDGTFADPTVYTMTTGPVNDLAVADLNGDGWADLVITDDWENSMFVYLNEGNGQYFSIAEYPHPAYTAPCCLALADLDGDGDLDIACTNSNSYTGDYFFSVLINSGNGAFQDPEFYLTGYSPRGIVAADLDDDGDLDIAAIDYLPGAVYVHYNQVCVDTDRDGYGDPGHPENECPTDNCPTIMNPWQIDSDADGVGDACTFEETADVGNTTVEFPEANLTLEFDNVTGSGTIELEVTSTGPSVDPNVFELTPLDLPVYYYISSEDVQFDGSVRICIEYDESWIGGGNESALTLLHWNPTETNITLPGYPNVTSNIICGSTMSFSPFALALPVVNLCGDPDDSDGVDIDDVVYLINFIFSGGPDPDPYESGDADCSSGVDIDDVVWLINYIFSSGNTPCDTDGDGVPDC